jgi:hypothetical protein
LVALARAQGRLERKRIYRPFWLSLPNRRCLNRPRSQTVQLACLPALRSIRSAFRLFALLRNAPWARSVVALIDSFAAKLARLSGPARAEPRPRWRGWPAPCRYAYRRGHKCALIFLDFRIGPVNNSGRSLAGGLRPRTLRTSGGERGLCAHK